MAETILGKLAPIAAIGFFATATFAQEGDQPHFATYRSPEGWILDLAGSRGDISGVLIKGIGSSTETDIVTVTASNVVDGKLELSLVAPDGQAGTAAYVRRPNRTIRTDLGVQVYSNWIAEPASSTLLPSRLISLVMGYGDNALNANRSSARPSGESILSIADLLTEETMVSETIRATFLGESFIDVQLASADEKNNVLLYTNRSTAGAIASITGYYKTFTYTIGNNDAVVSVPESSLSAVRKYTSEIKLVASASQTTGVSGFIAQSIQAHRQTFPVKLPNFVSSYVRDGKRPDAALDRLFKKVSFARCAYGLQQDGAKLIVVVCDYHSSKISQEGQWWFRSMASLADESADGTEYIVAENYRTVKANFVEGSYDRAVTTFESGEAGDGSAIGSGRFFPILVNALKETVNEAE